MKKVGRVGLKALIYFEVVTTLALIVGLIVVNLWQPGAGMNADPATIDTKSIQTYTTRRSSRAPSTFCCTSSRPPWSAPLPRARSCRCCSSPSCSRFALLMAGRARQAAADRSDRQSPHMFFGVVGIVMRAAPLGAFGAMAFTIGNYGIGTLVSLGELMAGVLRDLPDLHFRRARGDCPADRLQHSASSSATSRKSC